MGTNITLDDFGSICRICLNERRDMCLITTLNIITMIKACSSVHISTEDLLPQQVCARCVKRLENAYQLKEECESSDRKLRELIELKIEKREDVNSYTDVKEELITDAIKNEYSDYDSVIENDLNQDSSDDSSQHSLTARKKDPKSKKYNVTQYKCEHCAKVLDGVWRLALHMKKKHNATPIKCEKCDILFYHPLHLEEHLNNHDQSQLICKQCGRQYASLAKLKKHQIAHKPEMFHCLKCDCSFKGKFMLNKHEQVYHSGDRPREDCQICGKSVISTNMNAHMKIHQERTPYSCEECPKKFVREITLREHVMKIHRNQEIPLKQLCSICGRGFRGKSELRRHMRSHTGEKPFQCNLCEKRYREGKALKRHVLSAHMDERPFSCEVCSKAFHTKAILQAHMRTHTGERPYTCLICNKSFGSKTWLKSHIKAHNE